MPVVESLLPEVEPIEEPVPIDEPLPVVEVSLPLVEGIVPALDEPLEEPVPDAPMELEELGVLDEDDGEAPIVDDEPELLGWALVEGEVVDEPVLLVPELAMPPPDFGAVELLLLLAPLLPAEPPAWAAA